MTRAEMLARMSSAELNDWIAYEKVTGPLGPERGDMLHGIATAVLANANRGRRGRTKKASDFIPKWDRVKRSMSALDILATVRGINRSLGGTTGDEGGGNGDDRRAARGDRSGHARPDRRRRRRRG